MAVARSANSAMRSKAPAPIAQRRRKAEKRSYRTARIRRWSRGSNRARPAAPVPPRREERPCLPKPPRRPFPAIRPRSAPYQNRPCARRAGEVEDAAMRCRHVSHGEKKPPEKYHYFYQTHFFAGLVPLATFFAINPATYPPLNPASIFTTTTFEEQLLSMPNRAAMPPKLAP